MKNEGRAQIHQTMSFCWSRQVCCNCWLMQVPYQQKTVQTPRRQVHATIDNIHGGPEISNPLPNYQKNRTISH